MTDAEKNQLLESLQTIITNLLNLMAIRAEKEMKYLDIIELKNKRITELEIELRKRK
jgi:hypothetical protein